MKKTENQAFRFHFKPVDREHRSLVHHWLKEPHVAKWFYGRGVSGTRFYGSIYVDSLWIAPALRHQGWETKLMKEAEKIGKERGARFVTVKTMDGEALPFYKKFGYSIEFNREGYDKNSKMLILRKDF